MSLRIVLPVINGGLVAGLDVETDPGLEDEFKLHVVKSEDVNGVAGAAGAWAAHKFATLNQEITDLYTSASIVCVAAGLIGYVGETKEADGEWTSNPYFHADKLTPPPARTYSKGSLQYALTIIVATKANYWLTNHTEDESGYISKILESKFPGNVTDELVKCAHRIGRWAGTLCVFSMLNMRNWGNLVRTRPFITPSISIELTEDLQQKFQSTPAGTSKLAVAIKAAKRLVQSPLVKVCPMAEDFHNLLKILKDVKAYPLSYHVEASFLTGRNRARYTDSDYDIFLGRLGTYISVLLPNSTLCKSPHFTIEKIQSYPDYDHSWAAALQTYKANSSISITKLKADMEILDEDSVDHLRFAFNQVPEC